MIRFKVRSTSIGSRQLEWWKGSPPLKGDEEDGQRCRSYAAHHHHERKKSGGEQHLAEMKSRGGGHVQVEIGMMHVMESPEERNHVVRPVPPPVGVIE